MKNRFDLEREFDDMNKIQTLVKIIFFVILTIKLAIIFLIIWAGFVLYNGGLDDLGHLIGSFIGSIEQGMETK